MNTKNKNILLLWDRMGDYHRARWFALQNQYSKGKVFAADLGTGDSLYKWNSTDSEKNYRRLSKKKIDKKDSLQRLLRFIKLVKKENIGYVAIAGYGKISYLFIIIAAKCMHKDILIFAESWYPGNRIADAIKAWFVRTFCNHVFASGEKAADFFSGRFKYPESKIVTGYSVVDNAHFKKSTQQQVKQKVLLCTARFSKEKNLIALIQSFEKSLLPQNNWQLMIVGGGPQKDELEQTITGNNVKLKNWVDYNQLPELYLSAACFILPSIFEPWGLVVNEAMAAGLPVIVSKQCGCWPDLVDNNNGWVFDAEKNSDLVEQLNILARKPQNELEQMGKQGKEMIINFTPDTWATKLLGAFQLMPKEPVD